MSMDVYMQEEAPAYPLEECSSQPPSYTSHPSTGERRLRYNPHLTRRFVQPSGIFTKSSKGASISIMDQEENAIIPEFDRDALVNGTVTLDSRDTVTKIKLKFEGTLKTSIHGPGAGSKTRTLVREEFELWNRNSIPESPIAPSTIPFSFVFPWTFMFNERVEALPPSHRFEFCDFQGGIVSEAKYILTVIISRQHRVFLPVLDQTIRIPLKYYPHSRPQLPIIPQPNLFRSLKTCPEEWYQSLTELRPKPTSDMEPVQVLFFTPFIRTFGLCDRIPFHIQLTGSPRSMKELHSYAVIKVKLLRRVTMKVKGTSSWASQTIGEACLNSLPPSFELAREPYDDAAPVTMDWDGEVMVEKSDCTGSFSVANVFVKDFILLTVESSSNYRATAFMPFRYTVPIHLVTDTWGDSFASDDQLGLI